jgi:hypothetical protein
MSIDGTGRMHRISYIWAGAERRASEAFSANMRKERLWAAWHNR